MKCLICSHYCELKNNEISKCLVRKNINNQIKLTSYGQCSIISVEPIEKRPFFHFFPGSNFLSVGFLGCNFSCPHCLNSNISQFLNAKTKYYSPFDLLDLAIDKGVQGIVFTFNEPTIHFEYLRDIAEARSAHEYGVNLELAIKTNGYMSEEVSSFLSENFDAINIDIKGDEDFYRRCGGSWEPVRKNITYFLQKDIHVELSYLVPPSLIGSLTYHRNMCDWIASLSKCVPLHMLYYYSIDENSGYYDEKKLFPIYDIFREKMDYVYISNLYSDEFYRNTYCPLCKRTLIRRTPIAENWECSCCGKEVEGILTKKLYNILNN